MDRGCAVLVDMRYQVLDEDRAAAIHDPATPPAMVDETTGVFVDRPFMGHSHKGRLKAGHVYFVLFENPGNLVAPGTHVTVQLGGARVAHIPVG